MLDFLIKNSYLLSQILGFFSTLCLVFSFFQTKRTQFFILQTMGNIFIVLSYFALGRFVVSIGCVIATIRTAIFATFAKKDKDVPLFVVIAVIVVNVFACAFTITHWLDITFVIGLIIYTLGCTIKNIQTMRAILIFPTILYTVYALVFRNYTTLLSTIFEFGALIISIISDYVITKGITLKRNIKAIKKDENRNL